MKAPLEGGAVTTLASGQQPDSMALDSSNVYWANDSMPSSLVKVPIGGGAVSTLVTTAAFGLPQDTIGGIAVDAVHVYWDSEYGFVMAMPLAGGAVVTLASNQVPVAGGTPTTLATPGGNSIALNASLVAWTDIYSGGSVMVISK
jgi:sugar lactone lactonase YvrE